MKLRTSFIVSPLIFGLAISIEPARRRLYLTLPFVAVMFEGNRPWPSDSDPRLTELKVSPNELLAGFEGGASAAVADAFAAELDAVGAENYLALDFHHHKHGPISVTIQRKRGKTPADVAAELRREIALLRAKLAEREAA